MLFKGGTSLSKGYGLISRFIQNTLAPQFSDLVRDTLAQSKIDPNEAKVAVDPDGCGTPPVLRSDRRSLRCGRNAPLRGIIAELSQNHS